MVHALANLADLSSLENEKHRSPDKGKQERMRGDGSGVNRVRASGEATMLVCEAAQ